jgi:hypothetical protein
MSTIQLSNDQLTLAVAEPGAVCPEPFVEINAVPGETIAWEHRYELSCGGSWP